ncbi:DMT family transporter [Roseospira visakhapatnamensis]|uniref:Drug/metabolite transporter (DMT)-like permease n=1 Tax=Roseospira visakhapatnamensis TaxID=390880 RepID=A0A7W6W9K0_9PROT|nr:DMT family transporter [Roseospira visakhapatnamensis]MBB4265551.1 drug/metabolite transporter (DMT)-like permease [Roseospira visakhapatnamensis]
MPLPQPGRLTAPVVWSGLSTNVRGGLLMLASAFFFSVMATLIRYLGQTLPTLEMAFFRAAFQAVVLLPFAVMAVRRDPSALFTRRLGLHGIRLGLTVVTVMTGFYALVNLPLATAISISFSRALFVTLLAVVVLREVVGPHRWSAVAIGFLGVLVILRPWTGGQVDLAMVAGLISAAAVAGMSICVRLLSSTEGTMVMMLYSSALMSVILAVPAAFMWVTPDAVTLLLVLAMGGSAVVGQFLLISAYRHAEPSAVAPMNYTQLLWVTALGFVLFGEFPGPAIWTGAALIIGAALYTLHRERQRGRIRHASEPPAE